MALLGAAGTAIAGSLTSTAIGGALIKVAIGAGASVLANTLKNKKKSKGKQIGVKVGLDGGGDVPRSFILGRTITAGSLVTVYTWGDTGKTKNAFLSTAIALSDLPIQNVTALWVNDTPGAISLIQEPPLGYPIPNFSSKSRYNLWMQPHKGDQIAVDYVLGFQASADNPSHPWPLTRIGDGISYVVMTARSDQTVFSGRPNFKFEVIGSKLYDPSRDSSVGGDGPHRWYDESTWGGDGDHLPAVQIYNILRGIYYIDRTGKRTWMYGGQDPSAWRLPPENWIRQINKCRQQVSGADGKKVARYQSGIEINLSAPPNEAIDVLKAACSGRVWSSGGQYFMSVGEADAPVMSITDDDIISTVSSGYRPFDSIADSVNGVAATYPEPNEAWNTKAAPVLINDDYVREDGGRRNLVNYPLDAVYSAEQVQRLVFEQMAEVRRERKMTIVLGPTAYIRKVGDSILYTSKRNAFENKQFRIDDIIKHANMNVTVEITEVDPKDFSTWKPEENYIPPEFSPLGPIVPEPQPILGWRAEADVYLDMDGNKRRPAIRLYWDGDQDDIIGVEYEVAIGTSVVLNQTVPSYDKGSAQISHAILPNTTYQVRGRYIPASPRQTIWSGWMEVTTDDIKMGPLDVDIDYGEFFKDLNDMLEWVNVDQRSIRERIEEISAIATDAMAAGYNESQSIREELTLTIGENEAKYLRLVTIAISETKTLATRIELLQTEIEDDISQVLSDVSSKVEVINGKVTANATEINALFTQVNGISSSITIKAEAETTSSDGWARYGIQVKTGANDNWSSAAFFMDVKQNLSRIIMQADQFLVTNGDSTIQPLSFYNGRLRSAAADIGDVTAGYIHSPDNRFIIDLNNRRIQISD